MRFGIDVTALPSELYGAGNYIVNLTQTLIRTDPANDYLVFSKPQQAELFAGRGHAQVVRVSLPTRLLRIAWEQTFFPLLIRRYRLDLVHSPHYTAPVLSSCTQVVTFHDMTFFLHPEAHLLYKSVFFRAMIPVSARRAHSVIAISQNTRNDILRLFPLDPAKVFTIPYGIGSMFRPAPRHIQSRVLQKYGLPEQFVLYVGNLEPRQKPAAAPARVRHTRPARLAARARPRRIARVDGRAGVRDAARAESGPSGLFAGIYSASGTARAVQRGEPVSVRITLRRIWFARCSKRCRAVRPVITSNVASMPEIVGSGGVLIDPTNESELTEAMSRMLTDEDLRTRLAREGLERSHLFSWERAAQETLAVYEQAVHAG